MSFTAAKQTPGLIIAAPATGAGKTTLTLGLLRAFRNLGHTVAPFKIGPDYIDPRYHEAASGKTCTNLDGWAMRQSLIFDLIHQNTAGADLALAEGVMGLFDGGATPGVLGHGATADLARFTGWPVILVVNVTGIGQSVGALVQGFCTYQAGGRSPLSIKGVILNKVASPRHETILRDGLRHVGCPVLGAIPVDAATALPSRHLGLVQAAEHPDLQNIISHAADLISKHCDLQAIKRSAAPPKLSSLKQELAPSLPALGQCIAVAKDQAFGFTYSHILEDWRKASAEIRYFSPLANEAPPTECDAVFLPGGYPELHAKTLAQASVFLAGLKKHAQDGHVIYGECGGYMLLGEALVDKSGESHTMAGLLPLTTSFAKPKLHLGYRHISLLTDFAGLPKGLSFRAHEFHYASTTHKGDSAQPLFHDQQTQTPQGLKKGSVAGSFYHLIDKSEP